MKKPVVVLNGGSGFIGAVAANRFINAGYRVKIITRTRNNARNLWLLPDTEIVEANKRNVDNLAEICTGARVVVNLVGILNESKKNGTEFKEAHVNTLARVLNACKTVGVPHLIHISALGADVDAPSNYLRSKGEGERILSQNTHPQMKISVVRPSVVFGPQDRFTNLFSALLALTPGVVPLPAGGSLLQPLYVGDMADGILHLAENPPDVNTNLEFGGPEVLTLADIVKLIAQITKRRRLIIGLGRRLSFVQAYLGEFLPNKPITRDNLRSLSRNSVCKGANGILKLGIKPRSLDEILPQYLVNKVNKQKYYHYRSRAGR
jgi:uncharacterized protein YbjT (DUF2867 family)